MLARWQCQVCGYTHSGGSPPPACPTCAAPFTAFQKAGPNLRERLTSFRPTSPRPSGYRYVIVGNSAAGRSAAQAIAALDPSGQVTVISEEHVPVYARPMLPDLIAGMPRFKLEASGEAFAGDGIRVLLDARAISIDAAGRTLTLADGSALPYDALLLATGSEPNRLNCPGCDAQGIAYFRTLADAERLAQMASLARRSVVVGGGLLGLEFVRSFVALGLEVTQLVREPRLGFPALDEQASALLQEGLRKQGVRVVLEDEVAGFRVDAGRATAVSTRKGNTLECDVVGVAIGARPRTDLASAAGVSVNRGILVDRSFRTNVADVYAAGDVAEAYDRVWQAPRVNTSWRNAMEQGEIAGASMAGCEVTYEGAIAANYQLAAGLPFCTIGMSNPPDPQVFAVDTELDSVRPAYAKTVRRGSALVGAVLLGSLDASAGLEAQIRGVG